MKNKILFVLDTMIFISVCMNMAGKKMTVMTIAPSLRGVGGLCAIGAFGLSLCAALWQKQETEEVFRKSLSIAGFQVLVFLAYCLYLFL